jgi:hypothetical protein
MMNKGVPWKFLGFHSGVAEVSNLLEHESASLSDGIPSDTDNCHLQIAYKYHFCILFHNSINLPSTLFIQKILPNSIMLYHTSTNQSVISYYFMTTHKVKPVCNRHAVKLYRNIKKSINLQKVVTRMQEK